MMNERIQELVKKLGPDPVGYIGNWGRVQWADNVYPQLGDQMYAAVDLEEFVELIVKECLSQVDKVDAILEDDKEKTGVAWVGLAIAKHFGVE
jgi:hypothetical protein